MCQLSGLSLTHLYYLQEIADGRHKDVPSKFLATFRDRGITYLKGEAPKIYAHTAKDLSGIFTQKANGINLIRIEIKQKKELWPKRS